MGLYAVVISGGVLTKEHSVKFEAMYVSRAGEMATVSTSGGCVSSSSWGGGGDLGSWRWWYVGRFDCLCR